MKIAAFDSGIGGLAAIAPLFKKFPGLDVTYLGDLANLPYGTKSSERVVELTGKNVEWLLSQSNVKPDHLILACNTASAHAIREVTEIGRAHGVSVTGVLDPGCRYALTLGPRRILVLATSATVSVGSYEKRLRELGFAGEIQQRACPLFVPLVEDNLTQGPAVEAIIERYLRAHAPCRGDVVILGCTHYPFLLGPLRKLYPDVAWVEAGDALLATFTGAPTHTPNSARAKLRMVFTDTLASRESVDRLLRALMLDDLDLSVESIHPVV